jgi:ABC-2 type transport system ATP-binding protein
MDVLIHASTLVKKFGNVSAVQDISLQVARGEVLGFLGPNGAGKTTTMRMLTGFLPPNQGTVTIAGIDMWKYPVEAKRHVGYLPEGAPLYPDMTLHQLLRFVGQVRQLSSAQFKRHYDYVVDSLQLESVLSSPIDTLSKGFKRRVGMALALLHDPDVLILDEPTDGLDPLQKREVRRLIKRISAEKAIIISTHIMEEVDVMCSRAMIIHNGNMVADGTSKALCEKYKKSNLRSVFFAAVQSSEQEEENI